MVLKFVARHSGCLHGDLIQHVRDVSPETGEQVGGYLKVLSDRFQLIERRQPIFAKTSAKRGRYYLTDNFLRAWLGALANPVSAINFAPTNRLVAQADDRLAEVEGHSLEKLVGALYEERSRKGMGDFPLTTRIQGYWDRNDTEIDLVAVNETEKRIRFGGCKRSAEKLLADVPVLAGYIERFLTAHPRYKSWTVEKVSIAPRLSTELRDQLRAAGHIAQDLGDLTAGFR